MLVLVVGEWGPTLALMGEKRDDRDIPSRFDVKGEPLARVLFTAGEHFVVFGEPVPSEQPSKCALHDQAPPEMFYALRLPGQRRFDPLDEAEAALLAQFYMVRFMTVPFLMRLLWPAPTRRVRHTTCSR